MATNLGIATAYGYAKSKGYMGTEEEFAALMKSYADVAQRAETAATNADTSRSQAAQSKRDSEAYAQGTRDGTEVPSTDPAYHNNAKYYAEQTAAAIEEAAGDVIDEVLETATAAKDAAETAQGKAESAQEAAESAQDAAEAAQEAAETAAATITAATVLETEAIISEYWG